MPAAAARCGRSASLPPCSASRRERLRVLSYDVGGNFGTRNRVLCRIRPGAVGGRASSGARSNSPPRARNASSATIRAAISSPRSSWRCARDGRFLAHARHQYQQCRRALRLALAALQGRGADHRLLRHSRRRACGRSRSITNTMPTQAYRSSGRPEVTFAIERLVDTAAAQARHRPHRAAPQEPRAARGDAVRQRRRHAYDSGRYEENMDLRHAHRRLEGLCGPPPRGRRARQARSAAASPTTSNPRSARPRSRRSIRVRPERASTWSSAPSRPARATRRASPR